MTSTGRFVDLCGTQYTGIDVVPALIARNRVLYATTNVSFESGDLSREVPPTADLVLVRDLLIHLPTGLAMEALRNVLRSNPRFLLVSNYSRVRKNGDTYAGGVRLYNLGKPPFDGLSMDRIRSYTDGDGNQGRELVLFRPR